MATLSLDVTLERAGFRLEARRDLALEGITALFGPSGSGKTTLLRVLAGLEERARGAIVYDGVEWQRGAFRMPAHERGIGYVFQEGRLFAHLSVAGNLRFGLDRAGKRPPAARAPRPIAYADVVEALELESLLERRPTSLSGGEQQRVAIGRALLTCPRLLLMDEPLSSLDVARKREIIPLIERLPLAFGVPVLYVTHNLDEVARLATDMVSLRAGRIVAAGGVADVLDRTDGLEPGAARDPGAVLKVRVESGPGGARALRLREHVLHVPETHAEPGATLGIRIHARDVAIALDRPERLSIRNVLAARVVRIDLHEPLHADVLLEVDGQHLRSRITRDALVDLALEPGQHVFALIKSVALESTALI